MYSQFGTPDIRRPEFLLPPSVTSEISRAVGDQVICVRAAWYKACEHIIVKVDANLKDTPGYSFDNYYFKVRACWMEQGVIEELFYNETPLLRLVKNGNLFNFEVV